MRRAHPAYGVWVRGLALALFALVLSAYAWWPALAAYPATQIGDGQFSHQMLEATRVSIARFHELPLWNPYQCGGIPLWDNPQGFSAAPIFLLLLPFGSTRAIELWCVVHSAIGFLCMWVLARRELGLSRGAAVVASAMWAFAGTHNQHFTGGHIIFVSYLYGPLAVFFWRRAEHDLRMAVGLGAIVAMEIYEAGIEPLSHLAVILAAETLTRTWPPRRLLRIARAAVVVLVVAFCLSAARLLPVIAQVLTHTRQLGREMDALQWTTLKEMFLARAHERGVAGQAYAWTEYGDYLGPILLGLAALGIVLGGLDYLWLLALLALAFALMAGSQGPSWPWTFLNAHVFPFKQMRVPSRFNDAVTLFLAPLAGIGIDRVARLARRACPSRVSAESLAGATLAIGLVGVGDLLGVNVEECRKFFSDPPSAPHLVASPRFYIGGPDLAQFIDQPAQNRGRAECWEEWAFERDAPIWQGDVPQARAGDSTVTVTNVVRTQNTFLFDVKAPEHPAHVRLNSTWDRGWRTSLGAVADDAELLSVDVPQGEHHVVVRYWPRGLTVGLALTGLSSAALIALFAWDARRRRSPRASTSRVPPPG